MGRLILFMHTSLDGFVAGPKGEMHWIHVDEEIFDYGGKQIAEADTALYGRVTYQMMEAYWPTAAEKPNATKHDKQHAAWYKQAEKVVLSRTLKEGGPKSRIISDNVKEEIMALKERERKNIIMFGSPTAAHYLM